ncbi:kinase-like protein [Mytilinidion resinicola]|uniref:Kinase-like protein n=1 Tax=Mytilinidion resinicola TaxID=574789 RepID=A0A6A6XY54_9PEZI|nr:kinase-like protein [Mytilinidion resinicola]KAF2801481.1 kinase-like protein [Mytilinidion resinicola]
MGGINAWTDLWGSTALKTSNTAARVASGHTKPPRTVLHAAGNDSLPESSEPAPLLRQAESDIASSDTPRKPLILPLFRPISAVLSSDKDEHTSKEDEPTTSLDPKIESKKPNKKQRKNYFGEYILGQTLSQDAGVKVKLANHSLTGTKYAIRRYQRKEVNKDFYLEVVIQKDLSHPNIQRFYQLVETERHIGLVLQYASGGELFDYVLNHRYLKDVAARRLFAQLVSAVGYLHLKGIVHRNLKLETIQLDRNRNLIVTCFNLAKTFDLTDKLSEDIEYNLGNREFVERSRLTQPNKDGIFRGDLMQTSCGSPCYAAPELVVSDAMYTGRKADIWSCGIILYAMLAGYLPFDDDPANPDGDNMNLLYKYIVSTPLTFPEYLTPHARDLLKRILVPDPRKRSDMVEIARHSWLSEYVHVVSFVISETANVSGDTLVRSSEYREHSGSSEYREHSGM